MVRPSRRLLALAPMLLVAAAAVAPASPAAADPPTTLYVNNQLQSCADSGPGTEETPFCTISAAEKAVQPGQTIAIGAEYTANSYASLTITHSGTAGAPITFATYGSVRPEVYGFITLSGVHDVTVSGLEVEVPGDQTGVEVDGSSDVTLDRMYVDHISSTQTPATIGVAIDGASSGVTLSRSRVDNDEGSPVRIAPGASHVVLTTNQLNSLSLIAGNVVEIGGASDTAVTSNSINSVCDSAIAVDGGSSSVVENNVVNIDLGSCAGTGLSVEADSVNGVRSDYNSYYIKAGAVEYSWAGAQYATAAAFHAVTGQGTHDLDLASPVNSPVPPAERSPLIDSADANAPGELSTDNFGNPRVDDPLVTDTGVGTPAPDRGAYERQDTLSVTDTIDPAQGVGPVTATVTVTSHTSSWSEPVTYTADFGDNDGGPVPVGADGTATHTYQTPGVYTETTTVIDSGGSRKTATHTVTVGTPAPPQFDVSIGPEVLPGPYGKPTVVPGTAEVDVVPASDDWETTDDMGDIDWGDGSPVAGVAKGPGNPAVHEYAAPGTYPVQVTTRDLFGRTTTKTENLTVGDGFLSAANDPARVYDSRSSGGTDKVPAGGVVKLTLAQLNANDSGADASVVNLTVTNAKASGYIAVYPDGTPTPSTSNLNYEAGQIVANHAIALAGSDGLVDFYNHSTGPVDLIIDSYGFQKRGPDPAATGQPDTDTYQPVGPVRVLDTRSGQGARAGAVASKGTVTFQAAGADGVPADADAVVMNLTITDTKSAGFITAYPDGTTRPGMSNANWVTGHTASALVVVPLKDGKVTLYNSGPGTADFLADVVGFYYPYGTGSVFLPSQPTRLLDTRSGQGTNGQIAKLQPGQTITLPVASHVDAPATGVSAVELNLTATNPSSGGYITAYADGTARPSTSIVDFAGGQTTANMTITPVGADGSINLYNGGASTVDLIVDLCGAYYQYPSS